MLQRLTVQPLREVFKVHHVDVCQVQSTGEGFAEGVVRVESRCEEGRASEKGFEVEGERLRRGADGEGYGRFEKVSWDDVSLSGRNESVALG